MYLSKYLKVSALIFQSLKCAVSVRLLPGILGATALLFSLVYGGSSAYADSPLPINYTLTTSHNVSINIYNSSGQIVRELVHAGARNSGANSEMWDGRDDSGTPVASGNYSWKMLAVPGFSADFITSPGGNYPVINASFEPFSNQEPGCHGGPVSVAVDSSGFYVGAGATEGIENGLVKQSLDGSSRLWSAQSPTSFQGYASLASAGGKLFAYSANSAKVYPFDQTTGVVGTPISVTYSGTYPSDMAASGTNIILSYSNLGVVRWLDYTGTQTRIVNVTGGAKSVDVAPDGTVYVISGSTMQSIAPSGTVAQPFISAGLTTPRRAAVNPTNGDIYIVDGLPLSGAQVKRFSSSGTLIQTYGATGGRTDGLYVNTNFKGATDIAVDSAGSFWVTEGESAPRRTVHFTQAGGFVAEWYGGQAWAPWITAEPDNLNYVWMCSAWGDMMRINVNYSTRSWTIDSCFTYNGMANGLVSNHFNAETWDSCVHAGVLYLARTFGYPLVLKVDRVNRTLTPVCVALGNLTSGTYPSWVTTKAASVGAKSMIWTDANGDGKALNADGTLQTAELSWYTSLASYTAISALSPNLDYITAGGTRKYTVGSWNSVGAPVYSTYPVGEVGVASPPRLTGTYDDRWSRYCATDAAGNTWGGFNPNIQGWGASSDAFVARWNPDKTLAWQSGHKGTNPGNTGTLRHIFGVIDNGSGDNCMVISRFSYEWPAEGVTPLYVYDQDGLYVGQIIGAPQNTSVPTWKYGLGGEALAGRVMKDASGNVYLFAQWINEGRIYKITGWTGWQRSTGSVTVPGGYTAPASITEVTGPNSTGTGLLAQYWINTGGSYDRGFKGSPVVTRVDTSLDLTFNINGSTTNSPTGSAYWSGRWTGTLTPRRTGWHKFQQMRGGGSWGNLWVNNIIVTTALLNQYGVGGTNANSGPGRAVWLVAGTAYPITLQYTTFPPVGPHGVLLQWSEPETNDLFTTVPPSQLSPTVGSHITQTNSLSGTSQTAFPVSSTDLINAGQPTLASVTSTGYTPYSGSSTSYMNDGSAGTANNVATTAFDPDSTWTTTYTLDTTTNTKGYDISEIDSFAGWANRYIDQKYDLYYTPVGSSTPVWVGTFLYAPASQGANASTKIAITSTLGPVLTGVQSLIFSFQLPDGYATYSVYREIDAIGTPTH